MRSHPEAKGPAQLSAITAVVIVVMPGKEIIKGQRGAQNRGYFLHNAPPLSRAGYVTLVGDNDSKEALPLQLRETRGGVFNNLEFGKRRSAVADGDWLQLRDSARDHDREKSATSILRSTGLRH